jgi:hypothetical protein
MATLKVTAALYLLFARLGNHYKCIATTSRMYRVRIKFLKEQALAHGFNAKSDNSIKPPQPQYRK